VKCAACSVTYVSSAPPSSASAHSKLLPASSPAFPVIDPSTHMAPYHLLSWIDTHKHLLAPPVGNKMIHGHGAQWKVMIVGGPNERTDYHIDDGEEWFLMVSGDMTLKVVDQQGTIHRDIHIREGESFLLPANVPHSPQRLENTIGQDAVCGNTGV
jgi:mannose-6-phosphate isomerase-like protein (cupin superfamily)